MHFAHLNSGMGVDPTQIKLNNFYLVRQSNIEWRNLPQIYPSPYVIPLKKVWLPQYFPQNLTYLPLHQFLQKIIPLNFMPCFHLSSLKSPEVEYASLKYLFPTSLLPKLPFLTPTEYTPAEEPSCLLLYLWEGLEFWLKFFKLISFNFCAGFLDFKPKTVILVLCLWWWGIEIRLCYDR